MALSLTRIFWEVTRTTATTTTMTAATTSFLLWGLATTSTCRTAGVQNLFKPRSSSFPRTSDLPFPPRETFWQTRRRFTRCQRPNSKIVPLLKRILCRRICRLGYRSNNNNRPPVRVQKRNRVRPIQISTEIILTVSLDSLQG